MEQITVYPAARIRTMDPGRPHAEAVAVADGRTTADLVWGMADGFEPEWDDHAAAIAEGTFPLRIFMIPFEPKLRRSYGDDMLDFLASKRAEGDDRLGSIEAGKLADFTVLDDDPYEVDPMALRDIGVVGTVLGGEPTS